MDNQSGTGRVDVARASALGSARLSFSAVGRSVAAGDSTVGERRSSVIGERKSTNGHPIELDDLACCRRFGYRSSEETTRAGGTLAINRVPASAAAAAEGRLV